MPDLRAGDVSGRRARAWWAAAAAALVVIPIAAARADVFVLLTGDRISGKPVVKGKNAFTVETQFGRLVIPRSRIQRIIKPDGSEEVVNPPLIVAVATPEPAPPRLVPRPRLVIVIQGQTFFHAWSKKEAARTDPSLRLEVRLDEEPIASWVDVKTDPELKGAVLNSFSFAPEDVSAFAGRGVELAPPEVQPGRAVLKIGLAPQTARRRLRLAYQVNDGDSAHPAWRDEAEGSTTVDLHPDAPTIVQVHQDRGQMEFSGFMRRRMKHVGTFRIDLQAE